MLTFAIPMADFERFCHGEKISVTINGVQQELTCDGQWVDYDDEDGHQHRRVLDVLRTDNPEGELAWFVCDRQKGWAEAIDAKHRRQQ
jgi:hypothetical protein